MEDCLESFEDNGREVSDSRQHDVNKIPSVQPMSLPAVDRVLVKKMSPDRTQTSEGMNKLYRRSFDFNMFCSDHEAFHPLNLSHSDSELDRSPNLSTTSSDLTAEYLGFPRRLTTRGPSSFLHKLDLTPVGVPLRCSAGDDKRVDIKAAQSHDNEGISNSCNKFSLPKIEFSSVDTHEEDDRDSGGGLTEQGSPQILMEHVNYEEDLLRGPSPWIQLEPSGHMLLSPRSSNGSISSFRSSNADSAIEILTPDEEVSDTHEGTEAALSGDWESNKHRKYSEDTAWDSDPYGAIKKSSSHHHDKASRHSSWQRSIHPSLDTSHSHTDTAQKLSFISSTPSAIHVSQSQRCSVGDISVFQTPEVIISDFSCNVGAENKTSPTENKSSQTRESDVQPGRSPRYLGDYPYNIQRSLSSSSISSNESSTYSIFSDSSQEVDESQELPINLKKKVSAIKGWFMN